MGIDFGFTEESGSKNKYAKCRPYLNKVVGFYSEPSEPGTEDPWSDARVYDRVINVGRLRDEQPDLYETLQQSRWHPDDAEYWHWHRAWTGDAYEDRSLRRKLRPYLETKPSAEVLLPKLAPEAATEARQHAEPQDEITAWAKLTYGQRKAGPCERLQCERLAL